MGGSLRRGGGDGRIGSSDIHMISKHNISKKHTIPSFADTDVLPSHLKLKCKSTSTDRNYKLGSFEMFLPTILPLIIHSLMFPVS